MSRLQESQPLNEKEVKESVIKNDLGKVGGFSFQKKIIPSPDKREKTENQKIILEQEVDFEVPFLFQQPLKDLFEKMKSEE